ncbi:M43 family zinc metalloprotease [Aquimarina gracilis]|uniref:M43 family zinc metalloprotease n=1 Tax=Aquimarina gracilis TaxID=874422 RepID=A0ABU6A1N5_9FLAO|nr:M43 family zinc metalloprotease [Aquimarina gracilis]MEB3348041.1 M43 family zinc metalloprotease [Aquimarina gracilis]
MKSIYVIIIILYSQFVFSQKNELKISCKTSEVNTRYFENNKASYDEYKDFNTFSKNYYQKNSTQSYEIPVVFHVYGTTFNGKTVNNALIEKALNDLNKDFQGLNDDFQTVNSRFFNIKETLDITFRLAKKDPNGNETTGVIYHDVKGGYGNDSSSDPEIMMDAWDNYRYMNVYIQNDLYDDNVTNNSGVAWYPNSSMSDNNLARVVYNGAYIGTNTDKEFASTLTHEFAHWLNLIHTFEGGCNGTDEVDDTPVENGLHDIRCSEGTNCNGNYVNNENYMGYNGASGCYKMFTTGQVTRMLAALQHPSRITLWQNQNLIDTGLKIPPSENLPPRITINNSTDNNSFEEGESFTLNTTVEDSNGMDDIDRVEFYIGDVLANSINFAPFDYTFTDLEIGDHIIKAVIYDNGGLSDSALIEISVTPKTYFPEVKWISSTPSYSQNNIQFATGEVVRRIEIKGIVKSHEIIVKGPNFQENYTVKPGEIITIKDISEGTWIIEIPSINKVISKTFN